MVALMFGVFFVLKKQYDRQQLQEKDSFFFVNYRGFQLQVAKFFCLKIQKAVNHMISIA